MKSIFYHSADHDGHCSGAIVKDYCERNNLEFKLYPINYGDKTPDFTGMDVVMCDFSLPRKQMMDALKKANSFIWIDHHISAIKDMEGIKIEGLRNTALSACELTWMFFYPDCKTPDGVRYFGAYDSWRHNGNQEIIAYEWFYKTVETDPGVFNWDKNVFSDSRTIIEKAVAIGKYLYQKDVKDWSDQMKNSTEKIINGKKVICLNTQSRGSMIFGDKLKDYDYAVCYYLTDNGCKNTLYSKSGGIDVSVIAKSFGGGGHAHAAGCITEKPIWEYNTLE